jgi:hypothetical protein
MADRRRIVVNNDGSVSGDVPSGVVNFMEILDWFVRENQKKGGGDASDLREELVGVRRMVELNISDMNRKLDGIRAEIAGIGHGEDVCATMEALSKRVGAVEVKTGAMYKSLVLCVGQEAKFAQGMAALSVRADAMDVRGAHWDAGLEERKEISDNEREFVTRLDERVKELKSDVYKLKGRR